MPRSVICEPLVQVLTFGLGHPPLEVAAGAGGTYLDVGAHSIHSVLHMLQQVAQDGAPQQVARQVALHLGGLQPVGQGLQA